MASTILLGKNQKIETKRRLAIYAALLKALNPRAYERWFALQLREELLRRLPPYYERGYEYEAKIEAAILNAFYSGKLHAGNEMNLPVTLTVQNHERINLIRDEYEQDMDKILRELYVDPEPKMERYERRTEAVGQMGVWTAYNQGKLATLQEQGQRFVRFRTAEDELVCDECRDAAGIYPIEFSFPMPPLHINCRCELEYVYRPR